jgi:16S rRNA (guanine527-N7)-methyltransferase
LSEATQLIESAGELGVELTPEGAARLLRLLDELAQWNRSVNLTAITERGQMITHHLLDSLSVHAHLRGETVADVGTGAGFPGLPLALVDPQRRYTLIDSNNKKVRFVAHAARLLELANVTPLHVRAEALRPVAPFDTVVARAFAALPELLKQVAPLCGPATRVLAMKGKIPQDELAALPPGWRLIEALPLTVPALDAARSLIVLGKSQRVA